jgi:hypothetical protein
MFGAITGAATPRRIGSRRVPRRHRASVRRARIDAYAERFAAAGLGALVFDYRHFGSSQGEPRQLLDIKKQQQDYEAALAVGEWCERAVADQTDFLARHLLTREPSLKAGRESA